MRLRDLCLVALVAAVVAGCGASTPTVAQIEPSIVRIAGTACLTPIIASGFVVEGGQVVTVAHAIAGAKDDLRAVSADGTEHDVTVVAFDPDLDIAVLDISSFDGEPLPSSSADPGDTGVVGAMTRDSVIVPIDYEVLRVVNARSGDIYDQGRVERTALDVRSSADRGTSGAPLLDEDGAYVGMVFAISNDREDAVYALASSEIDEYLATTPTTEEVDRGYCR